MTTVTTDWGPLAEPIHPDAAGPGDPVWKDNAYIAFWDTERQVYGSFHVSTSPNAKGGLRARCSLQSADGIVEVIEELRPGSFAGPTISFGLDGTITVDHADLTARFVNTPLYAPADYSDTGLIPELVPGKPLQHFQQGLRITGEFTVGGTTRSVDGFGLRDRTWGFRDEATMWIEYAALVGIFDGVFVSAMKFLGADGSQAADGFLIDDAGSHPVADLALRRTAAAQFLRGTITLADGSQRVISMHSREAGFFVPMGTETDGPAFGCYDDFMTLDLDGVAGGGFLEQGIVHRVC